MDEVEPPIEKSFGYLVNWHLRRGTRPPGTLRQGEPWDKLVFAAVLKLSRKQLGNWIANQSLPRDTITIERVLFGRDQNHKVAWRMELREALNRTRLARVDTAATKHPPPETEAARSALTEEQLVALPDAIAKLIAALNDGGGSAERAGINRKAIIELAQRIKADVVDFGQALRELEQAVEIAIEVAEEGRRSSNTGDFVDAVLACVAEKSARGHYNDAAADVDSAFAQWKTEEAERRVAVLQGGLKLLYAGLKQDMLRRNPVSAAKRIDGIVALEHPEDRTARFAAPRARQREWFERGPPVPMRDETPVSGNLEYR
jgi:hypothetical protein